MKRRGFTLLELLVATTIMGLAVVGLVSSISTSMRNAARLTDYDRASLLARRKMDELILDPRLPLMATVEGKFDDNTGWKARTSIFEQPPNPQPGGTALERIELDLWWMSGEKRRSIQLDGYRRVRLPAEGAPQ